jgi:hypothetical protein
MDERSQRPLALRILTSRVLGVVLVAAILLGLAIWGTGGFSGTVTDRQAQFVADSVRRSSVQCYAIEGRFPPTIGGIGYLEDNYGLIVDHSRYVVYYESLGDNLIPQIRVNVIPQDAPLEEIADFLGLPQTGGFEER